MDTQLLLTESLRHIGYSIFKTIDINDSESHCLIYNDDETHTIILKRYKQYYRIYTISTARKGFIQLQYDKAIDPADLADRLTAMLESNTATEYKTLLESVAVDESNPIRHNIDHVSNDSVLYSITRDNTTIGSVYYYKDEGDLAGIIAIADYDSTVETAVDQQYALITA